MNPLVIKLTGSVDTSNFDEWKKNLIAQIHSVNKELQTEDDFALASQQVKQFKTAENTLKQAKQSALEQANDIQQLFAAIDSVTEEARQARLLLDRQIKVRKQEMKNAIVQSAIDDMQQFIDAQSEEFKSIDYSSYIEHSRFESIMRGKTSIKGITNAMNQLCRQIRDDIVNKAIEVNNNKLKIDNLAESYKLLFQDKKSLWTLPGNELDLEIAKRIACYNEQKTRKELQKKSAELKQIEDLELNPELHSKLEEKSGGQKAYQISIELLSTKDKAIELARSIKESYANNPLISTIRLKRTHK